MIQGSRLTSDAGTRIAESELDAELVVRFLRTESLMERIITYVHTGCSKTSRHFEVTHHESF